MTRAAVAVAASVLACVLSACGGSPGQGSPPDSSQPASNTTLPPAKGPCAEDGDRQAAVIVFNRDGTRRWAAPLRSHGFDTSGPVPADGLVLTNMGGELRAFDAATGEQRWRKDVGGPVYGEWVVDDVVVVMVDQVSDNARLLGLDLSTGEERWSHKSSGDGPKGDQVPTGDGGLAVVESDESLTVYEAATGKPRWTAGPGTPHYDVAEGVLVRSEGTRLVAYETRTGRTRWSVEAGPDLLARVSGDVVVPMSGVLPNPTPLSAYRLADGRKAWTAPLTYDSGTFEVTPAGLLVDEGPGGTEQSLALIDTATGRFRWKVPAQVYLDDPLVAGEFLVSTEGVPGESRPRQATIRRVADGSVKEVLPHTAIHGVAAGPRAYLVTVGEDAAAGLLVVDDGGVAWRAPLDRLAQWGPAVLADGGVAVQVADSVCATPD